MQKIMEGIQSVREADVVGKRVLLRTSLNVSVDVDGRVSDVYRLKRGLKTLEYLIEHGAKVVVVGYFGRKGETLKPVADALSALVPNIPIRFFGGSLQEAVAEVSKLEAGQCLVLENIRKEEGEEKNDIALAQALAQLADIFVSDAFAEAHRAYASNVGVAKLLPAYAGFLIEEEVQNLSQALTPPAHSLAVIGGAKFETKEPLIRTLLAHYETILLGGALGNDMLKVRGMPVGASSVSGNLVPTELAEDTRIILPTDGTLLRDDSTSREGFIGDTRIDEKIVDIGKDTARAWSGKIAQASFIVWNGPMGVYEKGFMFGTDALAEALARSSVHAIVGGGDTLAALNKHSFDPSRVFCSTGGGAMLEFLAEGTLPGIEALKH